MGVCWISGFPFHRQNWRKGRSQHPVHCYPGVGHVPHGRIVPSDRSGCDCLPVRAQPESGPPSSQMDELEDMLKGGDFSEGFEKMEGL